MRISDWSSGVCSSDLALRYADSTNEVRLKIKLSQGGDAHSLSAGMEIGRASCRERVCQYVSISVAAVSLKQQTKLQRCKPAHSNTQPTHTSTAHNPPPAPIHSSPQPYIYTHIP